MVRMAVLNTHYISARSPTKQPVHPVLLEDKAGLVLIDCGGPLQSLQAQASAHNMDLKKTTRILITHHDQDHISGLSEFKKAYPHVRIYASQTEAAFISGKKESVRLRQAKALHRSLPANRRHEAERLIGFYTAVAKTDVDVLIDPPASFFWFQGFEVLSTPGHMPGHISVYIKEFKTLIAGDALVLENGRLLIDTAHTLDMQQARKSAAQFLSLDIETLVCYHGGVLTAQVKERIKEALEDPMQPA